MIDTNLLDQAKAAVTVAAEAIEPGIATAKAFGTADRDQQLVWRQAILDPPDHQAKPPTPPRNWRNDAQHDGHGERGGRTGTNQCGSLRVRGVPLAIIQTT